MDKFVTFRKWVHNNDDLGRMMTLVELELGWIF